MLNKLTTYLKRETSIAPLVILRIMFGSVMCFSILRFMYNGWIQDLYVSPKYYFTYYGFDWLKPLSENAMIGVFVVLAVCAAFIALGFLYRYAALVFAILFTYVELIDKTTYLNHYYFISILAFVLVVVPANKAFSLDRYLGLTNGATRVPGWVIGVFRLQLGLLYFYAGIAKINPDWLLHAMPMKIWMAPYAQSEWIGWAFASTITPFILSWAGMLYDVAIPFLLLGRKTRPVAYLAVIGFHIITWLMFPIGMFPFIMIGCTLVFFPFSRFGAWLEREGSHPVIFKRPVLLRTLKFGLIIHFTLQILLPWRFTLYPGDLFWTEEGYRFSWRVMLIEKVGQATFTVSDPDSGRAWEVHNRDHLTDLQEIMMSTQPDMILQYAHYLESHYAEVYQIEDPEVRVLSFVALNGRRSKLFVDPSRDLTVEDRGWHHKDWILASNDHRTENP